MNCEILRGRFSANPSEADEEFDRHVLSCAGCRAYRDRMLRTETLINKALRFDVEMIGGSRAERVALRKVHSAWIGSIGAAAVLVVALTYWLVLGSNVNLTPEEFAAEITKHWYHEPESWMVTASQVEISLLADVLDDSAEIDLAQLRGVSYANSCRVAGKRIPHLVIQGEGGPYMVLLMPGRSLESPIPLTLPDEGLSGHIVPVGTGSIAVLGAGVATDIDQMEASIASAVNWTI